MAFHQHLLLFAGCCLIAIVGVSWYSDEDHAVVLYADDAENAALPDVSFLDGVLGGGGNVGLHEKEAVKKIERDRMLVEAAKMKMKLRQEQQEQYDAKKFSQLKTPKKNSMLKVLGLKSTAKNEMARLSKQDRMAYTDGELKDREQDISEQLHEKEKEEAREMSEESREKALRQVQKETSIDLAQIQQDKDASNWSDDDSDSYGDDGYNSYHEEEKEIRDKLKEENVAGHGLKLAMNEKNNKLAVAIKKDSQAVAAQVRAVEKHEVH